MNRAIVGLLFSVTTACAVQDESIGTSSAKLDLPSALPVPVDSQGQPQWDGSPADLLVADAWASCSFVSTLGGSVGPSSAIRDAAATDLYLQYILGNIQTATCNAPQYTGDGNDLRRWYLQRTDPSCNADPTTLGTNPVLNKAAQLDATAMPGLILSTTLSPSDAQVEADALIRAGGINYCIAQHIQQSAPGSAGANTLTMTAADQRQLLEIIRERTQLAMLQYARLLVVVTTAASGSPTTALQWVQNWFNDGGNATAVTEIGDALAASTQLLSVVAPQLEQLLSRSASARTPRGGGSELTQTQDMWGTGSWRGRTLGLLYGGDPLDNTFFDQFGNASPDTTVPWAHFTTENTHFPSMPFVSADARAPQVQELLLLAQRFDAVELKKLTTKDSTGCYGIDPTVSASRLYRAAEAGLETANCEVTLNNICQTVTPESLPDPASGYTTMSLWTKYRIDFGQAATLVSLLADETGRICEFVSQGNGTKTTYESEGGVNVFGVESIVTRTGVDAGDYYHVAKDGRFVARFALEQFEGLLGVNGGYGISTIVFPDADAASQGFYSSSQNSGDLDNWRLAGVVPAMLALRESLYVAQQLATNNGSTPNVQTLLKRSTNIMDLVGSTAGNTSYQLERPATAYFEVNNIVSTNGQRPSFVAYTATTDAFWDSTNFQEFTLHVFPYNLLPQKGAPADTTGLIPRIALDSSTTTFSGLDINGALGAQLAQIPATLPSQLQGLHNNLNRWVFVGVPEQNATYAIEKNVNGQRQFRLLIGSTTYTNVVNNTQPTTAAATGGMLNDGAVTLITPQQLNPSQPQFDAFGYAVRWSPPTDPSLIGSTPGNPAATTYLTNAQSASDSAVAAVTIAFQTLLDEAKAGLDQDAQIAKSEQVATAAKAGLCGEQNPDCASCKQDESTCDTAIVSYHIVPLSNSGQPDLLNLRAELNSLSQTCATDPIACAASKLYGQFDVTVEVDRVVANALDGDPNVSPTFDPYAGGSLQASFIKQYGAIKDVRAELVKFYGAYQAASAQENAANTAAQGASTKANDNCNTAAIAGAVASCISVSAGFPSGGSVSVNLGPLFAQQHACTAATADVATAQQQAIATLQQGISSMLDEAVTLATDSTEIQLALAESNQLNEQAKLTEDQAALDLSLAGDQLTNTLLYRRYHQFDVWRAQALLENARRYAIAARRAIESRYVVDLSRMSQAEPFVASPSLWADQIYEYDLNMPAAVGLSLAPQQTTGSVYPNVVADYVGNLQRFVNGFAVARPTASSQVDADVISLPGPTGLQSGSADLPQGVIDSTAYKWSFFCPDSASWVQLPSSGDADAMCGTQTPPTLGRLDFSLDPWARVDGTIAEDPYTERYNERWGRLAINLVGTAVLDCTKSSDPLSCYAQSFVSFDLTHAGPAWVTDFNESWQWT